MAEFDYELVVIGSGPAGEKGAAQAAYFGHKTALIEKAEGLGGACINTGTLASKTLRESALFLSGFKARQLYGLQTTVRKNITLSDFMYRRNQVQDAETAREERNLERHHIELVKGTASIADPHTVVVTGNDGSTRNISTKFILIATGSSPTRPKEVPFNPTNVFDSDSVLEMGDIPKSMLVIGGGVIGCEYACLFAVLGIEVTLVSRGPRVMEFLDYEISDILMESMRRIGVRMFLEDTLASAVVEGAAVRAKLGGGSEIVTDSLLYAAPRSGNTQELGIDKLGITLDKYGSIEVDPISYQTKVPNIYAAGDVIGRPSLASTSMEQGRLAMCHAFDLKYKTRLAPILPAGIYTIPEISSVGESEESCRKKNIPYVAGRSRFRDHARGQIIGDNEGMMKLIFSAPEGKLLGVHVIGEIASELVHIGMGCLHFNGDIDFFIQSVFNYPTLSDVYKYAAYDALGQLNRIRGAKA